ncbi:Ldh family oxidoreductase [Lacihabitans lacunae]|uniref:Ldh family oxidoreductase n=1 Tax=Lacihabitans lacunae TaxID=1028214 RepID=A0ABV7YW37_9BACT
MFASEKVRKFTEKIFKSLGCSTKDAKLAADVLINADLNGVDSHGVARLAGYVRLYDHGRLNPTPNIKIIHETPSTATIDGDRGLGLVVAPYAMQVAKKKAKKVGSGWVSVQNSNHFGIAGYHAALAVSDDMIGWAMTHSAPLVVPTFSKEKLLGTNPIAVAIPADKEPFFLADFATTAVAYGKMEILQRQGKKAPIGWVQDENGDPTDNANAVKEGGGLLPLGGDREHGSHKGYGLGAVVDILSGVLSGANFGPWVPPFATAGFHDVTAQEVGKGTGHFLGAMRIDGFRPKEDFKQNMDIWINRFRSAKHIDDNPVQIPGDQERNFKAEREISGLPLNEKVVESLLELGERFKVKF